MAKRHDAQYFIDFFSKIPPKKWTVRDFIDEAGRSCALGHCGRRDGQRTTKSMMLSSLFGGEVDVWRINDICGGSHLQKHPRSRILAALRQLKKKGL